MKYSILIIAFSVTSTLFSQETPLSSALFNQKETDAYQCIQVRRGDKIELTGELSLKPDSEELVFISLGGREYLLKGDLTLELLYQMKTAENRISITVKGIVLFEGLEERPAELEITGYSKQ